MERKASEGPFKGVAKEPDGRDTKRSPESPNRKREAEQACSVNR
jgi:hypothetical protein